MPDFRNLTLFVIRHGECEHNIAGRAASWDDSPLTATGRTQACGNGALLKSLAGDLSGFDFFASPLHRTCNTIELVREAAGLSSTGYRADRRLMEIDFGDYTWLTRAELAGLDTPPPALGTDWDYAPPRGESWSQLHDRVGRFLSTVSRDAVIVTHFGPSQVIRGHYLGLAPEAVASWRPPHAGIMRLSGGTETYFGA